MSYNRGDIVVGQSRSDTFAGYSTLEVEVCTCGVLFAVPTKMLESRRQTGKAFYCPNGHSLVYNSENAELKRKLEQERDRRARERALRDQAEASLRATKGVVTKLKKRAVAGTCPAGCKRHFKDLQRHMESKHPDYSGEKAT